MSAVLANTFRGWLCESKESGNGLPSEPDRFALANVRILGLVIEWRYRQR